MDEKSLTKIDAKPLTAAEERLLAVKINPDNYGKTVTALCQLAQISREAYYEIIKRPRFVEAYNAVNRDLLKASVGDIIQATIKFAVSSPKAHQDRKLLLEMAGEYVPRQKIEGEIDNNHDGQVKIVHEVQFVPGEAQQLPPKKVDAE